MVLLRFTSLRLLMKMLCPTYPYLQDVSSSNHEEPIKITSIVKKYQCKQNYKFYFILMRHFVSFHWLFKNSFEIFIRYHFSILSKWTLNSIRPMSRPAGAWWKIRWCNRAPTMSAHRRGKKVEESGQRAQGQAGPPIRRYEGRWRLWSCPGMNISPWWTQKMKGR